MEIKRIRRFGLRQLVRIRRQRERLSAPSIASLAILAVLIGAVWVAFSFVRSSLAGTLDAPPNSRVASRVEGANSSAAVRATTLSKRERLVYVLEGDESRYHMQCHSHAGSSTQAIPLQTALARGLTPCPDCYRAKSGAQ